MLLFTGSDDELYWTDGLDGKIGMATIQAGPEVRRGTSTFLDNIDGVGGIVAVDSDHFIGVCVITVEPLNNGHVGEECFVHCSEVVPSSEVEMYG